MKCKKCGVNNPINVNKCIYCGASLTSAERSTASRRNSQSQTRKSPSRKQKNRTDSVIIALIAVLLSVLIVMGSFYAFNSIPRRNGFHSGGGGGGIIDTNISFPGATHKVTFNLNYQTTEKNPEDQLVSNGDTVVMPLIAGRKGYAFGGWFEDSAYTNEFNFDTPVNKSYNLSAYWIDISDKTDTDGDGLPNPIEKYHKTDINKADTDGDGLSDYIEICNLNLDPLNKDTDNNMTSDGDEDYDGDGLSNLTEVKSGTDPAMSDSDKDGLSDGDEVNTYKTKPNKKDTDGDGASDGKEIELGSDPLSAQSSFTITLKASESADKVKPAVNIALSGSQIETLGIDKVENDTLFPDTIPGYMGSAYDFSVEGAFKEATISFEFDASKGTDPVIYYYNEKEGTLEALPTTVNGNIASAKVTHFSTYILIDRTVFESAFSWEDAWDSKSNYQEVEIVLVIDDSGSMTSNDSSNQRLSVAKTLIDNLPENSKIGVVRFESDTEILTPSLTESKDTANSFLNSNYFKSSGNTRMYTAIDDAMSLFSSKESSVLKMIVVLSDGETADKSMHDSVISSANNKGIKVYTVGLGDSSSSYFTSYLAPLASGTGATFYLAANASELTSIYKDISKKIDIETDSDKDGVPDYYEDNMVLFNGLTMQLDKNNPDTDGDSIPDGKEVVLKYNYNADKSKVIVKGQIISNPTKIDSDEDGFDDVADSTPLEAVCFKNFDFYKKHKFGDSPTITIFVDQPYRNSRDVINFDDSNEFVGHSFVGIDYNSTADYAGFWPGATDKQGNAEGYGILRALLRRSVDGKIMTNGGMYNTSGGKNSNTYEELNYNEKSHKWDIAKTFTLSGSPSLKPFIEGYTHKYNMVSDNCTTFAVNALNSFGLNPKIYSHKWTYRDGLLSAIAGTYSGYSPADAGEDIRENYNDYIYMENVKLRNGTTVEAVWDASHYKN